MLSLKNNKKVSSSIDPVPPFADHRIQVLNHVEQQKFESDEMKLMRQIKVAQNGAHALADPRQTPFLRRNSSHRR